MKKLLIFISFVALLPAFSGNAERKVSKIYFDEDDWGDIYYFVSSLEYDNKGRLISWKDMWKNSGETRGEYTFEYVDDRNIRLTGLDEDGRESVIDVTLNSDGLVESAVMSVNGEPKYEPGELDEAIYPTYQNGVMTGLVWQMSYFNNRIEDIFAIENGNPVSRNKYYPDDNYNEIAQITYTDLPNKCGMAYLPFIPNNCFWGFRSLALAGLMGYGSRNLAHSCRFDTSKPAGAIDYELDEDGYVLSMTLSNTYDADGQFRFEYCEVAGIEDVTADRSHATVHAENGSIVVDGPYDTVAVYNLLGVRCGESGLTPGVYIVDVDGSRRKISVR